MHGRVPCRTSHKAPIRTPSYSPHNPSVAAQRSGRHAFPNIPDSHDSIHSTTDQMRAIRTPVQAAEGNSIALHDAHALPTLDIPRTQSAVCPSTEQAATVGCESHTIDFRGMPR